MNKRVANEIKQIAKTIPQEILSKLLVEEPAYPAVLELIEKGLADPNSTPELKERLQLVKDSGMLNEKVVVVDKSVEALLDKWWEEELAKAIKDGRLPKTKKKGTLEELRKKGKQHARRSNKEVSGGPNKGSGETGTLEGVLPSSGGEPGEGGVSQDQTQGQTT